MKIEALEGIKELAEIAPKQEQRREDPIKQQLGHVLNECCKLMTDTEASVRSTLITLISYLLSHYDEQTIQPHLQLVVIYICNAMTHIHKEIRSQSLEFLNLLSSHVPTLICNFSTELIPNFVYLLKLASRSVNNTTSTTTQNSESSKEKNKSTNNLRLKIVTSFLKFIKTLFSNKNNDNKLLNLTKQKTIEIKWQKTKPLPSNISVLALSIHNNSYNSSLPLYLVLKQDSNNLNSKINQSEEKINSNESDSNENWWYSLQNEKQISELSNRITPLLIDYWMEATPTEFPNTTENLLMMQKILEILAIIHAKCNDISDNEIGSNLGSFYMLNRYIFTLFPFGERIIRLPGERAAIDLSEKFNHSICLIAKRFITTHEISSSWVQRIINFLILSFDNNEIENIQPLLDIMQRYFSLSIFKQEGIDIQQKNQLWNVFTNYFSKLQIFSPMKMVCLQFIQKILKLNFKQNQNLLSNEIEKKWLNLLPRLLFKAKSKTLIPMKEQILDILLEYATNSIQNKSSSLIFNEIQPLIIPFFYANVSNQDFFGSFCSSSLHLQRKSIFILNYFDRLTLPLLHGLVMCCKSPQRLHVDIIVQILELVHYKKSSLSIPEFLSFLLNILITIGIIDENSSHKIILESQQQLQTVLHHINQIISLLPYKSNCIHIIGPSICHIFENVSKRTKIIII